MILDLILMTAPILLILVAAMKMVLPWRTLDLTRPPPAPPSATLSFLALVATLALLVRWIITGRTLGSIFFAVVSVLSMLWSCRIAVRAEVQHEQCLETYRRFKELDGRDST